jgi:hypothetical protein
MSLRESISGLDEYRLVLVRAGSQSTLAKRDGVKLRLPRITIPRGTRTAEQLQKSIRETWQVTAVILDLFRSSADAVRLAVAEVLSSDIYSSVIVADLDEISDEELISEERKLVWAILSGDLTVRGPFARIGWVHQAMHWLRTEIGDKITFTGEVSQYNAGVAFALIRFGVHERPALWLKATGAPNAHEFSITRTLAKHFGDYLPPLVAYREDWNAWVSEEAGQPLASAICLRAFENAVGALATLQRASVPWTNSLLGCGCADQRAGILAKRIPGLIDHLEEAMRRQTSTRAQPIPTLRLRELGHIIEDAFAKIETVGIPDALMHNDINPGNILVNGARCVFIDWAEACVGNPFFTFQHMRVQAAREDNNGSWARSLDSSYKKQWRDLLTESQMHRSLALAPLLAIASLLAEFRLWHLTEQSGEENRDAYARSLARRMDRIAQTPEFTEALCS